MSETVKLWLLNLLDTEVEEVNGSISNNRIWIQGSSTPEEAALHESNITDLEEYKGVLLQIKKQFIGGADNA